MGIIDDIRRRSVNALSAWANGSNEDISADEMVKALQARGLAEPTQEKPKAMFFDPYAINDWGGWRQRPSMLTYEALRHMSMTCAPLAAIIQLRTNQMAQFARPQQGKYDKGYRVILRDRRDRNRSMTPVERKRAMEIERMLETTGVLQTGERARDRDSFRSFLKKGLRDTLTYDQWAFEKLADREGRVSRFIALPSETIRPAVLDVEHADIAEMRQRVSYVQVYENTVIAEFAYDELAWCIMNPRSDLRTNGFGFSPIEQIIRLVTAWLFGFQYNQAFFQQGSAVKGLLNIKGTIPDKQMRAFRRQWYSMISGVENAWRTPILNSEDIQWVSMHSNNREMEFSAWMDWVTKLICMPAGTRIQMADGSRKPIEDVQEGDLVVTHLGRARRVTTTIKRRHSDPLVSLSIPYGNQLYVTGNHPVLMVEGYYDTNRLTREFAATARWQRVDEFCYSPTSLARQDYVTTPRYRVDEAPFWLRFRAPKNAAGRVIEDCCVDKDLARWLGLFAAEGHASVDGEITFAFHEDENEFASFVQACALAYFGLPARIDKLPERHAQTVKMSSVCLAESLRAIFGVRQTERCIPKDLLYAQSEVLSAFLGGVLDGDGSAQVNTLRIATASRTFGEQLCFALQRLAAPAALREITRVGGFSPGSTCYEVLITGNLREVFSGSSKAQLVAGQGTKTSAHPQGHGWAMRLRSYGETLPFEGVVYNIEVEEDHSYIAEGIAVHNCAVYGVDPLEINFQFGNTGQSSSLNTGDQESKLAESKDKGLRPLSDHFTDVINSHLIWDLAPDFEFIFGGMFGSGEEADREALSKDGSTYKTVNEIRAQEDMKPLPGEQGKAILNSTWIQWALQKDAAAQQQQQGVEPGQGEPGQPPGAGAAGPAQPDEEPDDNLLHQDGQTPPWAAQGDDDEGDDKLISQQARKSARAIAQFATNELRKARVTRVVRGAEQTIEIMED